MLSPLAGLYDGGAYDALWLLFCAQPPPRKDRLRCYRTLLALAALYAWASSPLYGNGRGARMLFADPERCLI